MLYIRLYSAIIAFVATSAAVLHKYDLILRFSSKLKKIFLLHYFFVLFAPSLSLAE